jgi:hypothetical protein
MIIKKKNLLVIGMGVFVLFIYMQINHVQAAQVDTTNAGVLTKVAPGEFLPVSVKLANFGGGKKVDVAINYGIFTNSGQEIYSTSDTVAVETTANFVKKILIPDNTPAGTYVAKTFIVYGGQLAPATTQFSFLVERKIFGWFLTDFIIYGGLSALFGILMALLGHMLIKRYNSSRIIPFDYSKIPHSERTFYEILSDVIMQMRQRVGDDALVIASNIDGLKINKDNGRVIAITKSPSAVIAKLVLEYEKILGKKVSFSLRK